MPTARPFTAATTGVTARASRHEERVAAGADGVHRLAAADRREVAEIVARGEDVPFRLNQDATHLGGGRGPVDPVTERLIHRPRQRVLLVRPVERQGEHAVDDVAAHMIGHRILQS
jgi:hypothetical protein